MVGNTGKIGKRELIVTNVEIKSKQVDEASVGLRSRENQIKSTTQRLISANPRLERVWRDLILELNLPQSADSVTLSESPLITSHRKEERLEQKVLQARGGNTEMLRTSKADYGK